MAPTCDWTSVVSTAMVPSAKNHARAQMLSNLLHRAHVLDGRHVMEHTHTWRKQRRGHQFEGGVLGTRHRDLPGQAFAAMNDQTGTRPIPPPSGLLSHPGDFETVLGPPKGMVSR